MKAYEILSLLNYYYTEETARVVQKRYKSASGVEPSRARPDNVHLVRLDRFTPEDYVAAGPTDLVALLAEADDFPSYWDGLTIVFPALIFQDTTVNREEAALFVPIIRQGKRFPRSGWGMEREWLEKPPPNPTYTNFRPECYQDPKWVVACLTANPGSGK